MELREFDGFWRREFDGFWRVEYKLRDEGAELCKGGPLVETMGVRARRLELVMDNQRATVRVREMNREWTRARHTLEWVPVPLYEQKPHVWYFQKPEGLSGPHAGAVAAAHAALEWYDRQVAVSDGDGDGAIERRWF